MSFLQAQQNCSFRSICQMQYHLLHSGINPCREVIERIKNFQRGSFIGTFPGSHTQIESNSIAEQEIITNSGGIVLPVVLSQQLHIVYVYNEADTCTVFHTTRFSVEDKTTLQKIVEQFLSRSRRKLAVFTKGTISSNPIRFVQDTNVVVPLYMNVSLNGLIDKLREYEMSAAFPLDVLLGSVHAKLDLVCLQSNSLYDKQDWLFLM